MAETTTKAPPKKAAAKTPVASTKPAAKKPASKAAVGGAKPEVKKPAAKKPAAAKRPAAAKPAAVKAKPVAKILGKAMIVSNEQRYRMVAEAAYYRAESNQFKSDPVRDWIEAESDIATLLSGSK